jgi:hypothetical protein
MGAEDGMWTEAHRARHEPGLKELVAACAADEIAAWLAATQSLSGPSRSSACS